MCLFLLKIKNWTAIIIRPETDRVLPINRSDAILFDQKNQMKTSGFCDE
jgi:hypothetical protein